MSDLEKRLEAIVYPQGLPFVLSLVREAKASIEARDAEIKRLQEELAKSFGTSPSVEAMLTKARNDADNLVQAAGKALEALGGFLHGHWRVVYMGHQTNKLECTMTDEQREELKKIYEACGAAIRALKVAEREGDVEVGADLLARDPEPLKGEKP